MGKKGQADTDQDEPLIEDPTVQGMNEEMIAQKEEIAEKEEDGNEGEVDEDDDHLLAIREGQEITIEESLTGSLPEQDKNTLICIKYFK